MKEKILETLIEKHPFTTEPVGLCEKYIFFTNETKKEVLKKILVNPEGVTLEIAEYSGGNMWRTIDFHAENIVKKIKIFKEKICTTTINHSLQDNILWYTT